MDTSVCIGCNLVALRGRNDLTAEDTDSQVIADYANLHINLENASKLSTLCLGVRLARRIVAPTAFLSSHQTEPLAHKGR